MWPESQVATTPGLSMWTLEKATCGRMLRAAIVRLYHQFFELGYCVLW